MTKQVSAEVACCQNTDRELWREREGDYYSDSIHVTEHGGIGINVGGLVFVKSLKAWHELADKSRATLPSAGASTRGICPKCDLPFTNLPEHMTCHREPSPPPPQPAAEGEWAKGVAKDFFISRLEQALASSQARIDELERSPEVFRKGFSALSEAFIKQGELVAHLKAREADLTAALKDLIARFQGAPGNDESDDYAITTACSLLKPASALTATKEEGQ